MDTDYLSFGRLLDLYAACIAECSVLLDFACWNVTTKQNTFAELCGEKWELSSSKYQSFAGVKGSLC